jgi:hypothetical protein
MKVLEDAGFIRVTTTGNRKYAKVFLVHPAVAMQGLRDAGKIPNDLWQAYRNRAVFVKGADGRRTEAFIGCGISGERGRP